MWQTVSTFDSTKRPSSMVFSPRLFTIRNDDAIMRMRDFNNVENLGQTTSTRVNFPGNKRIVESMLKESLNAFKLVQHRFNIASTHFNNVERGGKRFQHFCSTKLNGC